MSRLTITLFRSLILALLVLCTGIPAFAQCPPAEVEATPLGAITPNGAAIAAQCPEACPNFVAGQYVSYGWGYDFLDYIEVQCSDAQQSLKKIWSTPVSGSNASTCWNCVGGCGQNCPPGELCLPVPRSTGSDCQRFGCPSGYTIAERQAVVNGEVKTQPYCVRTTQCPPQPPIPPITVQLEGPATIRTGGDCTWTANAFGGSGNLSYTWYVSNNPVGYGPYYTGGRPSGTLVGYSWRLRVTVTDGTRYTSQEVQVSESSSAPICMQ